MHVADTDVLIDYLAGTEPAAAKLKEYAKSEQLHTTSIACFELLSGAREGKRGDHVRRLVAAIPILPLDRAAALRASVIHQELERAGAVIGMADCLIAGIALTHNLPLLTRNRKHFETVRQLRLLPLSDSANR